MRRITSCLVLGLLLAGSASLSGCIVASPRPVVHARVVVPVLTRVWTPGYWAPRRAWVGGYWRYH